MRQVFTLTYWNPVSHVSDAPCWQVAERVPHPFRRCGVRGDRSGSAAGLGGGRTRCEVGTVQRRDPSVPHPTRRSDVRHTNANAPGWMGHTLGWMGQTFSVDGARRFSCGQRCPSVSLRLTAHARSLTVASRFCGTGSLGVVRSALGGIGSARCRHRAGEGLILVQHAGVAAAE